jgi:MoxR-like ATPase
MPPGNPQVGEIWQYCPKVSAASEWRIRAGHEVEITSVGEGSVQIRFVEKGSPSSGVFSLDNFDEVERSYESKFSFVASSKKEIKEEEQEVKKISEWTLAEQVIPEARLVLLYGPPGTGKTTAGNRIGLRGGKVIEDKEQNPGLLVSGTLTPVFNIYNITLTEETPATELRGHYIMKGGDFDWHDGTGMRPFRKGGRLVLNEIDKASGDCLQFCHALLDDPSIAAITLPTGETVRPHNDFSVVATMNGEPEDLPEALRDRFSVRINIKNPHPQAIKSLPEDLRAIAKKTFKATTHTERAISFRAWKAFAHLREALGEDVAALAVFGSRAENVLNTMKIEKSSVDSKTATYVAEMEEEEEAFRSDIYYVGDPEHDDDPRY